MKRLNAHNRGLLLAVSTSFGSTCTRRRVGCVLTRDDRIVATGYNGAPRGGQHCIDLGCLLANGHCIRTVHAELNACLQCLGEADTAYCTDQPCIVCLRALINKGVKKIYWWRPYGDSARDVLLQRDTDLAAIVTLEQVDQQLSLLLNDYYQLLNEHVLDVTRITGDNKIITL